MMKFKIKNIKEDGKIIKKYYINDKEVNSDVYKTLHEDYLIKEKESENKKTQFKKVFDDNKIGLSEILLDKIINAKNRNEQIIIIDTFLENFKLFIVVDSNIHAFEYIESIASDIIENLQIMKKTEGFLDND
jgi:hypothetical protein